MEIYYKTSEVEKALEEEKTDNIVKIHIFGVIYAYLTKDEFDNYKKLKKEDFGKKPWQNGRLPKLNIKCTEINCEIQSHISSLLPIL